MYRVHLWWSCAEQTTWSWIVQRPRKLWFFVATKKHLPLVINKFLGANMSPPLKWKDNTRSVSKKAQRLFFIKQIKKRSAQQKIATILLSSCWRHHCFCHNHLVGECVEVERQLNKVVHAVSKITGCELPFIAEIYKNRLRKKSLLILKDPSTQQTALLTFCHHQKDWETQKQPDSIPLFNTM